MENKKYDKLLMAVVQGNDSEMLVHELTHRGFYVTVLNSMGGFLKRRSVTVMAGLESERLQEALDIIRSNAGKRLEKSPNAALITEPGTEIGASVPVTLPTGGAAVFVLDMEKMERY